LRGSRGGIADCGLGIADWGLWIADYPHFVVGKCSRSALTESGIGSAERGRGDVRGPGSAGPVVHCSMTSET
jgi:hypothetical protein